MSVASAFEYCARRVRQLDYENYLCALFLPKEHRPAALALRAFNVETATALGVTKEPRLALMRLRWWRDALDALDASRASPVGGGEGKSGDGDPASFAPILPDHPVFIALHAVFSDPRRGSARTKRWLKSVADARVRDAELGIENLTPGNVSYLEAYSEKTSASLLYLQLDACGVGTAEADHAASHLGKAIGIANLLRGTAHHARQRRCYLPVDVLAKHGAVLEDVYRLKPTEEIKNATHEVASLAKTHLDSSRALGASLSKTARTSWYRVGTARSVPSVTPATVFLPAVCAAAYLERLEARDFDAFHPAAIQSGAPLVTQAKLAWAAFQGKY
jgi:NADH dehydrogenase [ubiquinone] 1 alpha subcomplex assembly factor 6